MKADITHENEKTAVMEELMKKLGSRSIPFLAVFPGNSPQRPFILRDIYTRSDLRKILESIPDPVAKTP
jgi:thiol:disulfide interchange protein